MAITQTMTDTFKLEVLQAIHNFTASTGDTFKMALYTNAATLNASTTAYTTSNEVAGIGYIAGGLALTSVTPVLASGVAVCDFNDAVWPTVTISSVRGALIYNSSKANRAVSVLNFGSDRASFNSSFTVIFPTPDAANAIIRVQ